MRWSSIQISRFPCLFALALLAGCASLGPIPHVGTAAVPSEVCGDARPCSSWNNASPLASVKAIAHRAKSLPAPRSYPLWARCAAEAYRVARSYTAATATEAALLATDCSRQLLRIALDSRPGNWAEGDTRVAGLELVVEFRGLPSTLTGPLELHLAQDVSMALYQNQRHQAAGFGVPLVLLGKRCADKPLCRLLPPEGVFRAATAWVEPGDTNGRARPVLVIANPLSIAAISLSGLRVPLALDTSAPYAYGVRRTKLPRLAVWGLLGGSEVSRRAGVYLLEDYDPSKRPIVMIHGLGSSPLAWAKLSNAIWGHPDLRSRFQVWHVVYQTNAPLLVTRRRVQGYLDDAWGLLDPEGDDPARSGVVLVGHSLGGVVSRMLCVDSGEVLWNSAFTGPLGQLNGDPADLKAIENVFVFKPYPGVSRAIFLAAPHRGSPGADAWFGRLMRALVGRRTPEIQALRRVARDHPETVREELRDAYQQADLNSISTLQAAQPVRRAGESLVPVAGISYHVISGALPGRLPETDGAVPLASTLLPGSSSTLVVDSGHNVYDNDQAIAEVLRILRSPN